MKFNSVSIYSQHTQKYITTMQTLFYTLIIFVQEYLLDPTLYLCSDERRRQ